MTRVTHPANKHHRRPGIVENNFIEMYGDKAFRQYAVIAKPSPKQPERWFSLWRYLLIVFALSWPFQFYFAFKASTPLESFLFSSLTMLMVSAGTFLADRFIFHQGFARAGWNWGKPMQYLLVLYFALFLWLVPTVIDLNTGVHPERQVLWTHHTLLLFLLYLVATLPAAFGEEFGWRGYLLPLLAEKYGARKGLLLHAFIWWCWHLPVIAVMGWKENAIGMNNMTGLLLFTGITLIPGMLHAVIYAWIWARTGSLAVVVFYHAAFDEVRDVLEKTTGISQLAEGWQMITIILVGSFLLWKSPWGALLIKGGHQSFARELAVK